MVHNKDKMDKLGGSGGGGAGWGLKRKMFKVKIEIVIKSYVISEKLFGRPY